MYYWTETKALYQKIKVQGQSGIMVCWKQRFMGGGIQYSVSRIKKGKATSIYVAVLCDRSHIKAAVQWQPQLSLSF